MLRRNRDKNLGLGRVRALQRCALSYFFKKSILRCECPLSEKLRGRCGALCHSHETPFGQVRSVDIASRPKQPLDKKMLLNDNHRDSFHQSKPPIQPTNDMKP